MNQIRHILSACLILLMIFMAVFLYTTFPESGIVARNNSTTPIKSSSSEEVRMKSKGEQIFKQNCAACHGLDKGVAGPPLRGVHERGPWKDRGLLKEWIKDPGPFLLSNAYAKELKNKYGLLMPPQKHLSETDIEEVIKYITQP